MQDCVGLFEFNPEVIGGGGLKQEIAEHPPFQTVDHPWLESLNIMN